MPTEPRGQKRPADVVSKAVHAMKVVTGQADDNATDEGKNKAAQALGSKGGAVPAKAMSPVQRSDIARKAASTRWKR